MTMSNGFKQLCQRSWRALLLSLLTVSLAASQPASEPKKAGTDLPPTRISSAIAQALDANQTNRAADLLQHALKLYPAWREGWWQMGTLAYEQNDYLDGRLAFSELAKLDPKAGAPWVMLGLCDFELRDFGISLIHIQKGRALGFPKNPQLSDVARYHQALDLILLEEYEQAGFLLDSFAREGHVSDDIMIAEGLAALHLPAIGPDYRETVDPAYFDIVKQCGKAQLAAADKHLSDARSMYEELVQGHPEIPGLHYAFGALLARWGELTKAIGEFNTELKINPGNVPARLQIAYSLYKQGSLDAALPAARTAVHLAPGSFAAHFVLGQVLVGQGHLEDGARELEASRDLQPDSSQVHYALAQAYLRMHRRADAMKERAEFQRLSPIEASMLQKGTLPAFVFESDDTRRQTGASNPTQ